MCDVYFYTHTLLLKYSYCYLDVVRLTDFLWLKTITETGKQQEVETTSKVKKNKTKISSIIFRSCCFSTKSIKKEKHLEWQQQQLGFRQLHSSLHGKWKHEDSEQQNIPDIQTFSLVTQQGGQLDTEQALISAFSSYRATSSRSHICDQSSPIFTLSSIFGLHHLAGKYLGFFLASLCSADSIYSHPSLYRSSLHCITGLKKKI